MPGWDSAPQSHSRVSNINFDRPSCGLDVQNPTHSLKSVKDPGNTFELNPKWERTLLSFDNFYGIFIAPPKIEISKLTINFDIWI
jgi:hypothetical protein